MKFLLTFVALISASNAASQDGKFIRGGSISTEEIENAGGTAILPGEVDLLGLGIQCESWDPSKCATTGVNTCYRVTTQCNNICDCQIDGDKCGDGTCVAYGQPVPSPRPPTPMPTNVDRQVCNSSNNCRGNEYCSKRDYNCGQRGLCVRIPTSCPMIYDPVCGCDGNDYSNACEANAIGRTTVAYYGTCYNDRNQCNSSYECKGNEYCSKQDYNCGQRGECVRMPTSCPMIYDPVCGCDGRDYSNACEANLYGRTTVAFYGTCR